MSPVRSSVDVLRVLRRLFSLAKPCAPIPRVILLLILYDPPAYNHLVMSLGERPCVQPCREMRLELFLPPEMGSRKKWNNANSISSCWPSVW